MAKKTKISFMVVARVKRETADAEVYQVRLRSKEGHLLTLVDDSSAIFNGFIIGDSFDVVLEREQTTLTEEKAAE